MTAVQTRPRTALAKATPKDLILETIHQYAHEIASLAPKGISPARYFASLTLHLAKNPDLLKCDPVSIAQGMLRVASTGLELGVSCDLLPFVGGKNPTCQFNPRYNGLIELALASGVRAVDAGVVRDDDPVFVAEKGTPSFIRHQRGPGKGKIVWAYAIAQIKVGAYVFEVMSRDEVDAIRKKFSKSWWQEPQYKGGRLIPLEEIDWYAQKTVIRKLAAKLPKNAAFAAALAEDADIREIDGEILDEVPEGEYQIQQEPSAAASSGERTGAGAPVPPAAHQPEESAELTLEQAIARPLVGASYKWNGNGGKPLGSLSSNLLTGVRKWCATQLEKSGDDARLQLMVDAITLILIDRETNQTTVQLSETRPPVAEFPAELPSEDAVAAGIQANEQRAQKVGL